MPFNILLTMTITFIYLDHFLVISVYRNLEKQMSDENATT